MGLLDKATQKASEMKAAMEAQMADAAAQKAAAQQQAAAYRQHLIAEGRLMQYKVETLREKIIGDKIDHTDLEALLNRYAAWGWTVKTITSASVTGRVGPGGVSGLIVVFERPVTA